MRFLLYLLFGVMSFMGTPGCAVRAFSTPLTKKTRNMSVVPLHGDYRTDWDKRFGDSKLTIDDKLMDEGYPVEGDPIWSSSHWEYKDEDDENERYSRTLHNPSCAYGRDEHEFDTKKESLAQVGWAFFSCKHCAAEAYRNLSLKGRARDDPRPYKFVCLLKNKKTGSENLL